MAAVRYRIGLCKRQRRENPGRPRGAVVHISVNRCIKKYRLKNRFSRRFSNCEILQNIEKTGAPGEIRTPDPQIRSLVLYPAELRARMAHAAGFGPGLRDSCPISPGSAARREASEPSKRSWSHWQAQTRDFAPAAAGGALSRGLAGGRQPNAKAGAAIIIVELARGERDRAAVAVGEVGGDRQAEAGAAFAAREMKRLENAPL
jgi:hypothetical protein